MHKPVVLNKYLDRKWSENENEKMLKRLTNVKKSVDINCPESFKYFKERKKEIHHFADCNNFIKSSKRI